MTVGAEPSSMTSTVVLLDSVGRLARTIPAVPPPTMIKSYSVCTVLIASRVCKPATIAGDVAKETDEGVDQVQVRQEHLQDTADQDP